MPLAYLGRLVRTTSATHLLAVEQHRQVVWHLALVPNNPRRRTVVPSRSSTTEIVHAGVASSKKTALPPQLHQLPLIAGNAEVWCPRAASKSTRRRTARRDIELRREFAWIKCWRADRLDGKWTGRGLAAHRCWRRVFGRGEVRGRRGLPRRQRGNRRYAIPHFA